MSGLEAKIDRNTTDLVEQALRLKGVTADRKVVGVEVDIVDEVADLILHIAAKYESVGCDIQRIKQLITIGSEGTPNVHLRARENRVRELLKMHRELRRRGKTKAPTQVVLVEARGGGITLGRPKLSEQG